MRVSAGSGENRDVRGECLEVVRRESIKPAAIARDCRIPSEVFVAWLNGGRTTPDYISRVTEWMADRITIKAISKSVNNDLRANAALEYLSKAGKLLQALRDPDVEDREDIADQIELCLADARDAITLMAAEQTLRGSIKPGDKFLVLRHGGKVAAND